MSSEWVSLTLDDVCLKITDGAHQSPKSVEKGRPMCSVKDLTEFGLNIETARHISVEDFDTLVRQGCMPIVGDVLIAKDGNSALDTVCSIDEPVNAVLLSSVAILRPDPCKIDTDFLKYYFKSSKTIDYLKNNFISGAAIPRVVLRDFKKAEILLPDLNKQKAISKILRSIDDKINLNSKVNQTLEQMAQTIFKSWFVDFEPVKAKIAALDAGGSEDDALLAAMQVISGKDPQQLTQLQTENPEHYTTLRTTAEHFPNSLIESELGDIPEGWENFKMIDLVSQIKPGTNYQPKRQEGGIPFVNGKHVQDGFLDFSKGIKYITQEEYERVHKSWKPEVNDVLITRIGTLGRVAIVTKHDLPMAVHYNSIIIKEGVIKHPFIFFLLRSDYFQHFYHLYKKQAVQEFVTIDAVEGIQVCLPIKKSVLNGLTKIFDEFLFKLRVNHCESNTLAQLRDALLPKLLSGELSVNQDFD